jgi:hypothetical protein
MRPWAAPVPRQSLPPHTFDCSTGRTGSQAAELAELPAHDITIAAKATFRTIGFI